MRTMKIVETISTHLNTKTLAFVSFVTFRRRKVVNNNFQHTTIKYLIRKPYPIPDASSTEYRFVIYHVNNENKGKTSERKQKQSV